MCDEELLAIEKKIEQELTGEGGEENKKEKGSKKKGKKGKKTEKEKEKQELFSKRAIDKGLIAGLLSWFTRQVCGERE